MEHLEGNSEVNLTIKEKIEFVDNILKGNYGSQFSEDSHDPTEVFEGPFIDYNDPNITRADRDAADELLDELFRNVSQEELSQKTMTFKSPEGMTTYEKYEIPLGQEDDVWYISKWQNSGELPSYIFWPDWMYDAQIENGYEEIEK